MAMKTKKEIAALLKVTPRTVTNLEKRGLLPPRVKRGIHKQSRAFYPDDAIDYLANSLAPRFDNEKFAAAVRKVAKDFLSQLDINGSNGALR
jgi:phage terminase Nu1 subunit (DNA packaging protein)